MNNLLKELKGYYAFTKNNVYSLMSNEYPGYTGNIRYLISTDADEESLINDFPEIMLALSPYLIVGKYYSDVKRCFESNERKHRRRFERYVSEEECQKIGYNPFEYEDDYFDSLVKGLTSKQKSRIYKHFYYGKTTREIADEENVSINAVNYTIRAALKNLRIRMRKNNE